MRSQAPRKNTMVTPLMLDIQLESRLLAPLGRESGGEAFSGDEEGIVSDPLVRLTESWGCSHRNYHSMPLMVAGHCSCCCSPTAGAVDLKGPSCTKEV